MLLKNKMKDPNWEQKSKWKARGTAKQLNMRVIKKTSRTRLFSRLAVFINNLLQFIRQLSSTNTYTCLPSHQPIKQSSQKASLNLPTCVLCTFFGSISVTFSRSKNVKTICIMQIHILPSDVMQRVSPNVRQIY